ncbi:hypothetical protein GGX14DRAFT_589893 [Mycena pura]|uniref:Cytochrome b561 domain-containing protein n=1 Tax=Mycena pura TaxID=153505 RepID=A0AAD6VW55_9AGAR|nr:hypothetical protein GGX14DRAFT_589893 [Mycena pura]
MMRVLAGLLVLLWFQAFSVVRASAGDLGCNLFFCLKLTVGDDDIMTFEVKPIFEPFGWVGLGWGRKMEGTHMVVMWHSEDGSPILSHRYGIGHVEPVLEPKPLRAATLVPPTVTIWPDKSRANYSTTAFRIPLNKTDPTPGTMIWAYATRQPDPVHTADLTGHYVAGTINMRLPHVYIPSLPELPVDDAHSILPHYQKVIWHGTLLSAGFLVLLPAGSLIARWGRTFTPRWVNAHRTLNFYVALPVIACGWVLGPLAVTDQQASHFSDLHQICGLLLFALYIAQLFVGRYIHSRRAVAERPAHPPPNILHVALGISSIGFAFFQIHSGFGEWSMHMHQDVSQWCRDALTIWAVILPILYFGGLVLLKRQLAQEKQGEAYEISSMGKSYMSLSNTPIFDSEHDIDVDIPTYSEIESNVPLLSRAP